METSNNTHWVSEGQINTSRQVQSPIIKSVLLNNIEKFSAYHNVTEVDTIDCLIDDINFDAPKISTDFQVINGNSYFANAQRWIGYVTEISDGGFLAELHDLVDPTTYEMGEFDFKEVTDDDRELVVIGAKFYWSIGYAMKQGSRERSFELRFQRLVNWTEMDYNKAIDRADDLFLNLNWD